MTFVADNRLCADADGGSVGMPGSNTRRPLRRKDGTGPGGALGRKLRRSVRRPRSAVVPKRLTGAADRVSSVPQDDAKVIV